MSKKNKRKFASQAAPAAATAENTPTVQEAKPEIPAKQQENGGYNMNKELRNLAIIATVLIAFLVGIYYYDQQTHILQQFTNKLFALF